MGKEGAGLVDQMGRTGTNYNGHYILPDRTHSWAGEHELIKINNKAWDNVSTWFWIVSLHLSLTKSLRKLKHLNEANCSTSFEDSKETRSK